MDWRRLLGGVLVVLSIVAVTAAPVDAVHEGDNLLGFAPIDAGQLPDARGDGLIDFRGGEVADSRWTATFQFTGLAAITSYTVVVQGRFGDDGTPDATAFTAICTLTSDSAGSGGCWYYFVVLRRLATVELREGGIDGPTVLQATRGDGPGSITGRTNAYSPPTIAATPIATPLATPAAMR